MIEETDFVSVISSITVMHRGGGINDETATRVSLDDEGAGAFVVVEQDANADSGRIAITPEEWPEIRATIDKMMNIAKGSG